MLSVGGDATGTSATPSSAIVGNQVDIDAGTNPGFTFSNWTSNPSVSFTDGSSSSTDFTMLDMPVTITANWIPEE